MYAVLKSEVGYREIPSNYIFHTGQSESIYNNFLNFCSAGCTVRSYCEPLASDNNRDFQAPHGNPKKPERLPLSSFQKTNV